MGLREDIARLRIVASKVESHLRLAEKGLSENHATRSRDLMLHADVLLLTKRLTSLLEEWRGPARSQHVD